MTVKEVYSPMEKKQFPPENVLPDELLSSLRAFLSSVRVDRFSKNLRNLFLSHIYNEMNVPSLDLEEFVLDLQSLFELLDAAEKAPVQRITDSSFL